MKKKKIILTSIVVLLSIVLVFLVSLIITKYFQIKEFENIAIDFANKNPYDVLQ